MDPLSQSYHNEFREFPTQSKQGLNDVECVMEA